jgi:hypothetical protein
LTLPAEQLALYQNGSLGNETVFGANGNSGNLAMDDASYAVIDVNVTAVAGAGTMTLSLQRMGLDGNLYTVWTASAAIAAAGKTEYQLGPTFTGIAGIVLSDIMRLVWTIAGTSVTASISVIGIRAGRDRRN